jgi:hypothetical protein
MAPCVPVPTPDAHGLAKRDAAVTRRCLVERSSRGRHWFGTGSGWCNCSFDRFAGSHRLWVRCCSDVLHATPSTPTAAGLHRSSHPLGGDGARTGAQVEGRSAGAVTGWLGEQSATWREAITHVAMDLSSSYGAAVRTGLPHAVIVAERSHLVRLAGRHRHRLPSTGHLRDRGRRGRKVDPCGGCAAGCSQPTNDSGRGRPEEAPSAGDRRSALVGLV